MANRRYIRSRLPNLKGRTAFVRASRRVQREYRIYGSWKRVGAFYGVSGASARHVAMGREPHAAHLRQAFGLPIIVSIAACPKCSKLHDQLKVCPDKRRKRKPWVPPLLAAVRSMYRQMTDGEVEAIAPK